MNATTINKTVTKQVISEIISNGTLSQVTVSKIKLNPKNYRKIYDEKSLAEFAEQIRQHGILSSLIFRPIKKDHYELVVGERRFRAAQMIGLTEIPGRIVELTDKQVLEIQLDENMSRENPHPLDESDAISMMLDFGHNIEEISLRLGKSKGLIYNRIKLSELIQPIKEMFINNVLNIQAATELAGLDTDSQNEFFERHCSDWKNKGFRLDGLSYLLNQYKFSLEKAPFDSKDKNLIEQAGACTDCPFNSATLESLFPDMEQSSICSNKKCYWSKCSISLENSIAAILQSERVDILAVPYKLSDMESAILEKFPDLQELPCKDFYDLDRYNIPDTPKKEAFIVDKQLDNKAYTQAIESYKSKLEDIQLLIDSGEVKKGIHITGNTARLFYYYATKQRGNTIGITAEDVKSAIKNGTATPELLQQEIERIEAREKRAKELDQIKIQEKLHKLFITENNNLENTTVLTKADQAAARWIILECLPYGIKDKVIKAIFPRLSFSMLNKVKKYQAVAKLTDKQFAFLIRSVLSGLSESKNPEYATSYFLYNVAIESGMDVKAIEAEQGDIAKIRQKRVKQKIADVNSQIDKLSKTKKLIA